MYTFSGSYDSRYFACKTGHELTLLRFENAIWTKTLPHEETRIIGIGNNGSVVIQDEEGLWIHFLSEDEPMDFLAPFSAKALAAQSAAIQNVVFKDLGTQLCFERITLESKGKGILGALKSGSKDRDVELHEIVFYSIPEKKHDTYHKFSHPSSFETKFLWSISKSFNYMITGEPHKAGRSMRMKCTIVYVDTYESYHEFTLVDPRIERIMINDHGTALVDHQGEEGKELLIITSEGKRFSVTPPEEYTILHLGRNYVAMLASPQPTLIIKSFENILMCSAELKSLDELNIPFEILFNIKDELDIIHVLNNEVKVQTSGVDRVHIDAKRWALMARHVRESAGLAPVEVKKVEQKRISMEELTRQKKGEYGERVIVDRADAMRAIESLKLQFITGQISEEDYVREKEELEKEMNFIQTEARSAGEDDESADAAPFEEEELPSYNEEYQVPAKEEPPPPPKPAVPPEAQQPLSRKPVEPARELPRQEEKPPAQVTEPSPPARAAQPVEQGKPPIQASAPPPPPEKTTEVKAASPAVPAAEQEKERIERLLMALEERFIMGEISEDTYRTLKTKYTTMIKKTAI